MSAPTSWQKPRKISVVVDNDSWILPYAQDLTAWCNDQGDEAVFVRSYDDAQDGGIAFFLGCTGLASDTALKKNPINLVVHESDLPKGRGFAPMSWQILDGQHEIPICLIEAGQHADSGDILGRDVISLRGHELHNEWRALQGQKTVVLCQDYLSQDEPPQGVAQTGEHSIYEKRRPKDSALDLGKPLGEQFDLLRIVDNENYPAFFEHRGQKYILKIIKADS